VSAQAFAGQSGKTILYREWSDILTQMTRQANSSTSGDAELYALVSVLSVLSVLGVAGNLVVLYVFSRPPRRDGKATGSTAVRPSASATVYIMALAVADLVTCLLDIPSTVYMEWVDFRMGCDVFCKLYQVRQTCIRLQSDNPR